MIQIRDGGKYAAMALEQGSIYVSLEDVCRGKILDRNLVSLTGGQEAERIVVFPSIIEKEEVIRGLSEILDVPRTVLAGLLNGAPCYLPYQLSQAQVEAVKERGWKGVAVLPVNFRYGDRPLAAQVTGHLGKITSREELSTLSSESNKVYHYGDVVGKIGLESMYESELKGERPERSARVYRDAGGNILNGSVLTVEEGGRDGRRQDLVLTIDARIQQVVEDVMDNKAIKGAVVVMEAGTGDLLAMAGRPAFHPARVEDYLREGGGERFFDRCTALYQPGSIFKIVVAAAALEEGVAGTDSLFTCGGTKDNLIHCWNDAGHGSITFSRAFAESCNPAFARVGLSLGAQKIIGYAGKLGLDNQSVTGYPVTPDPRQDLSLIGEPYNLVNSSVGQGPVLVSPVQVTAMVNAVVSDGVYRVPRLVKEVRKSSGGAAEEFASDAGRQAIRPDTAAVLRDLLELATDEGAGKEASVPFYGSAGKTGSAQTGNSKQSVNAWFTGYAPRVNPRYIVTVLVEDGASGSESAAPVFREIMEQILRFD
ncbi:penicillin-binding protein 2 [Pelotomaculum terephthalicicum JT]|uniref:peptidoglycan D,D-transpeptidase FtsI family protein n=2 Tax=Pelotomaculum TaxID=191373 RepID=UPI001F03F17D|nr:penicillin-binding transpeptidase domain-containing protein [Pelotomaculum terephthalicicum]MCG9969085.1 penicillin-binding protein 2 [Pelotomaculum terephthalicicum JT]